MRFYNIQMAGKFIAESRSSAPSYSASDAGRIYYNSSDNNMYYNNGSVAGCMLWTTANTSSLISCLNTAGDYAVKGANNTFTCCNTYNANTYYTTATGIAQSICVSGAGSGIFVHGTGSGAKSIDVCAGSVNICGGGYLSVLSGASGAAKSVFYTGGESGDAALCVCSTLGCAGSRGIEIANASGFGMHISTGSGCGIYACSTVAAGTGFYAISAADEAYGLRIYGSVNGARGMLVCTDLACYAGHFINTGTGAYPALYALGNQTTYTLLSETQGSGVYSCTSNFGGGSTATGVIGQSATGGVGVCGCSASGFAVSGNTAYNNSSSKYLKYTESICISECLRANPLNVYYYTWEDSNYYGFNGFIGPLAEDFKNTFNIDHNKNTDGDESLFTIDGIAFGLANENFQEIEKLKIIVSKLYSCIQKLEGDK